MIGRTVVRGRWHRAASLVSVVAASAALIAGTSADPASAALRLAPTKITLARSHSPVITGNAVDFSGVVTPHSQRSLTLQQKLRGKWKPLATAKSNSSGAYKFRWVISAPGTLSFRVGVKATKKAQGANSPNVTVVGERWHYLSDEQPVQSECECENGPIEINGKTYAHSVFENDIIFADPDWADYNLRRSCVTLTAVAGLGDDSSSDASAELDVLLDGTNKFSHDFGLGQSAKVSLKINGNLRLRLSWTYLAGSDPDIGWGDARILCKW